MTRRRASGPAGRTTRRKHPAQARDRAQARRPRLNFARNTGITARHPDYGPNALTVVDLGSGPLGSDTGEFSCQPVEVGYGPCSVAILDVAALPAHAQASRISAHG